MKWIVLQLIILNVIAIIAMIYFASKLSEARTIIEGLRKEKKHLNRNLMIAMRHRD
jgi:hypothetical protein